MLATGLTLFLACVVSWLLWRKRKFSLFKNLNIPGPEPNILFGNYWEILQEDQDICINKWIKLYGRVFGYYYGLRPVLIVADPDLLKVIQVKEFFKFMDRPKIFEVGSSSSDYNKHAITTVTGKKWKTLRSTLTPTFTTSKLKVMSPTLNYAIDELLQAVEKESSKGKEFDIYRLYQHLTMDVIARTSLGVHTNAQNDADDPFVKFARIIFSFEISYFSMLTYSFTEFMIIFSFIKRVVSMFRNRGKHPRYELMKRSSEAIKARRKDSNIQRKDVLQLMMDAQKIQDSETLTAGENDEAIQSGNTKESNMKNGMKFTDEEILQNAAIFLLAGYETTSTALAFTTHLLSYHQDIQDKVREEIRSNLAADQEITYEDVNNLRYLDKVLNESLRIFPPILHFINRQGIEDTIINNFKIPKHVTIQVPVYNLHHDPTFWEDPQKFNPERFSPEAKANRHPMVFQPFGAGPRNCIGMRLAQMETKMALAKLLLCYKIKPKKGTNKDNFAISKTIITMRPKKGVMVEVEKI